MLCMLLTIVCAVPLQTVTVADSAVDWFAASKNVIHTFPGQGPYTGQLSSCCRAGNTPYGPLLNNANLGILLWNTVDLRRFGSNVWKNSSPVSSQVPIQRVVLGQLNQWVMGASDDDLDPLTYRLATGAEITGDATGGTHPPGFSIASGSGLISFNVPSTANAFYSTMIVISDGYCEIAVDFLMYAVQPVKYCACAPRCRTCSNNGQCAGSCTCANNNAPNFIPPSPWLSGDLPICFIPGQATSFALAAQDAIDTCNNVFIESGDLPVGAALVPRTTTYTNTRTYDFTWTPTLAQAGTYRVSFIPRDNANGIAPPTSVEIFVPASSGASALPTVTSWGPQNGESNSSAAITIDGSNFRRGIKLRCSFKKVGAPASAEVLIRPVWLNNGNRVTCIMPNETVLGGYGTRQVEVKISNFASCNMWRTLSPRFTFYGACPESTLLSGPNCSYCPAGKYQATALARDISDCSDCPAGRYGNTTGLTTPLCSGQCPPGRYGEQGSIGPQCNGTCSGGFRCPAGSSSPTAIECGAGQANPANVYCPAGSHTATTVQNGFYSTPESADPKQRSGQLPCDNTKESCVLGIRYILAETTRVCFDRL